MKNFTLIFLLFLGVSFISCAQSKPMSKAMSKQLAKENDKQYKKKISELNKEGWKIDGTAKTLEVKLLEHYNYLNSEDYAELSGNVSSCRSKNVCRQAAYNNAVIDFANKEGSYVKGRVTSDLNLDASSVDSKEFDKMYAAYERLIEKEIKGEIQESYSIYRQNGETFEYQTLFLINKKRASDARLRALEQSLKETTIAQEYAEKIASFIKEGFQDTSEIK